MIDTDTLLEKCPRCGAWPMAASLQRTSSPQPDIPSGARGVTPTRAVGYAAGRCSAPWFGIWTQPDPVVPGEAELAVFADCETTSHPSARSVIGV